MKLLIYLFIFLLIDLDAQDLPQPSETILFHRQISYLLQEGIEKALVNKIDESYHYFEEAYKLAMLHNDSLLIPIIVISKSRLYLIEEKYDEAYVCVLRASKYIESRPVSTLAGDYFEFLGQCYTQQKKYDLALEQLRKCEKIRKELEPGKNWRTYNGMARIYKILNQVDPYEKYSDMASKLSKIQNSKRIIMDMQNELKFDEQSGTISFLNQENFKTRAALQRTKFRNQLLLVSLISFVILTLFLFFILRLKNKHNREIALKNDIIGKSLIEKEALMKEIHHRVKNNLQIISSLLSLQSRAVEDQNASDALLQSQSRVISMSLIHETLYRAGPNSELDLSEYITNLGHQIFNTYNIKGERVVLHLDVDHCVVDVSILVPLGLIINELITNALKYAFTDREEGNIWVSGKLVDGVIRLIIWDDGIGMQSNFGEKGFGIKLIETFAKKLNAQLEMSFQNGTKTVMAFNLL